MAGFRDRRPSRHGAPARRAPGPELEQHDPELDSYLAALARDAEPGATETTGRFGSAQVFQLRLPALRIEQLRRVAEERGTSPGALATEWVLERLEQEDAPTGPMPVTAAEAGRRAQLRLPRRG
ncbi:hypothetical protein LWC35_30400 [Pseudonocardia kujensis]|uniref:hypothetical protein n=1 Tax=Pseudonocardia kujensis TaxID=1128675 RepID=UPI001E4418AC|nr:hypothetical protein [Pseudonocardia kujensis]MCE0767183.1 hypothetical protein [Pseudonocardia kujensis]